MTTNTSSLLSLGDPRAAEGGDFCGHRMAEGEDLVLESGKDWVRLWRAGFQEDLRELAKSYLDAKEVLVRKEEGTSGSAGTG